MNFIGDQNHTPDMIRFENNDDKPIIKVIGVGGGGCNAVNHMFNEGIKGVDFIICNTDAQSLNLSPIPIKIQLGSSLTEGRGAGSLPSVGRNAALENIEDIKRQLEKDTKMLFITAGMGGGTGTGAAPVIAAVARELNILTVGIVTIPFNFEGSKRRKQAEEGINELRQHVDSLLIICNDKLRELCGDLPLSKAFNKADNILTTAAKGIAEIITVPGYINVDFEDVKTVMKESGVAIMGSGVADGPDRALLAVEEALTSPLLNDNNIDGANNVLLYISSGNQEVTMDEVTIITDYIQAKAGKNADIIWGNGIDQNLEGKISVTLVATGFETTDSEKKAHKNEPNTILVGVLGEADIPAQRAPEPQAYMPPQPRPFVEEIRIVSKIAEPEPEPEATFFNETTEEAQEEILPEPEMIHEEEIQNETPAERIVFELYAEKQEIPEPTAFQEEELKMEADLELEMEMEADLDLEMELEAEPELEEEREEEISMAPEFIAEVTPTETFTFQQEVKPPVFQETENFPGNRLNMERTSNERISKLKELSLRLKSADGIEQLEKEPAYMRGQVDLQEPKHSSESEISGFTISEDSKGGMELKQKNPFIHGRPD